MKKRLMAVGLVTAFFTVSLYPVAIVKGDEVETDNMGTIEYLDEDVLYEDNEVFESEDEDVYSGAVVYGELSDSETSTDSILDQIQILDDNGEDSEVVELGDEDLIEGELESQYDIGDVSPSRYFVEASSREMAEEIAKAANAKLKSYDEGIAILQLKIPLRETLNSYITGISPYEDELEVTVLGANSSISDEDYSTILYQDDYCTKDNVDTNPGYYNVSAELELLSWYGAYDNDITGKGSTVAVLDTGCDINHEDLADNIIGTYNAVKGGTDVTDNGCHGTHVAGIIAAADNNKGSIGIAPDAKLYIMKVEDVDEHMWISDIIRALNKCMELGNINVINMSFSGCTYNQAFYDSLQECINRGMIPVCAAGNEGTDSPRYPAAYGLGLSVGSVAVFDMSLVESSNYGINCNILAPGAGIYSTVPFSNYGYLSGTSMACPYISGIAALIYGNERISRDANGSTYVKNLIINSNNGITYYSSKGTSAYGVANIQNIFNTKPIDEPDEPWFDVETQKDTKQKIVSIQSDSGIIYYTTDGSNPTIYSKVYKNPLHIDKKGTTIIKAIAVNKRVHSTIGTQKVKVAEGVISQKRIKSVEIYINDKGTKKLKKGTTTQLKIRNNGKSISPKKFKWSSSNKNIATVDKTGKVTINKDTKSKKKVTITAKLGSVKKTIKITVK